MSKIWLRSLLTGATLSLCTVAVQLHSPEAQAQSYPRVIGSGENAEIDYGPSTRGNIVGGGSLTTTGYGNSYAATYADSSNLQQPRSGLTPMSVSDGSETRTEWTAPGTGQRSRPR